MFCLTIAGTLAQADVNLSDMTPTHVAYLDHAATTPMDPAAIEAMVAHMGTVGNPSSLHRSGRDARRLVEESREDIARIFGSAPSEVVFTSGGTESDNLAIKGIFWARNKEASRPRVLLSAIEHHAVMDPAHWLATHEGAELVWIPVDESGLIDLDFLATEIAANHERIALVSVMWANNEVGTIQPIEQVVELAHAHGIPVHSDAVQAAGHLPINFSSSGLDAMTITAHKLGGPVGVGALFAARNLTLVPVQHGGGQEREVRSGTLDALGITAFAAAVKAADGRREAEANRLESLRDQIIQGISSKIPSAHARGIDVTGPDRGKRLPSHAHFTFEGCEGDSLIFLLDNAGVQVSTGSACQAGVPQPSHVLLAMGVSERDARGALRFTLGNTSSQQDVDLLLDVLPGAVERATAAGLA